jgi:hypothetical protein
MGLSALEREIGLQGDGKIIFRQFSRFLYSQPAIPLAAAGCGKARLFLEHCLCHLLHLLAFPGLHWIGPQKEAEGDAHPNGCAAGPGKSTISTRHCFTAS